MVGALVFLVAVPTAITYASLAIDGLLGLELGIKPYNIVVGAFLVVAGLSISGWAALSQWRHGRGSPLPVAPTEKLVVTGPYAYCRNPIMLGSTLYYLGFVLVAGSLSGVAVVALFEGLYGVYIKLVEEKELEARFGREYVEYRESTPFLIPLPRRRRPKGLVGGSKR
ncbi:MAG: hypothetical protein DRO18_02415 [Thermoprotei archaeon]|nr:MAG: hypothetical protein DRO18_02415 [Thermoprotei archaeon]